jgi:hypothetical protein
MVAVDREILPTVMDDETIENRCSTIRSSPAAGPTGGSVRYLLDLGRGNSKNYIDPSPDGLARAF